MAKKVRVMKGGEKQWLSLAFLLLFIIVAAIAVPVLLKILQRHFYQSEPSEIDNSVTTEVPPTTIPTATIVFAVSPVKERECNYNSTGGMSYKDKILAVVEKLIDRINNPCETYVIEEFSDKVTFTGLLTKKEVIHTMKKIFQNLKPTGQINTSKAIESFNMIPWSQQITYILFVPHAAMYRKLQNYNNDMKSAASLLEEIATENSSSLPRVIVGEHTFFKDLGCSMNAYSSHLNVDELTEAILLALQNKEIAMEKNLLNSSASNYQSILIEPFPNTNDTEKIIGAERIHSNTVSSYLPTNVTESVNDAPHSTFTRESEETNSTTTMNHSDGQSLGTTSISVDDMDSNVTSHIRETSGNKVIETTPFTYIVFYQETMTTPQSKKAGNVHRGTTSAKTLRKTTQMKFDRITWFPRSLFYEDSVSETTTTRRRRGKTRLRTTSAKTLRKTTRNEVQTTPSPRRKRGNVHLRTTSARRWRKSTRNHVIQARLRTTSITSRKIDRNKFIQTTPFPLSSFSKEPISRRKRRNVHLRTTSAKSLRNFKRSTPTSNRPLPENKDELANDERTSLP